MATISNISVLLATVQPQLKSDKKASKQPLPQTQAVSITGAINHYQQLPSMALKNTHLWKYGVNKDAKVQVECIHTCILLMRIIDKIIK